MIKSFAMTTTRLNYQRGQLAFTTAQIQKNDIQWFFLKLNHALKSHSIRTF